MIQINRLQKYFFNGLLLSVVAIIMRTVSVSFNVYVTSKVGAEGMGLLNLTSTVYGFAITLATSGINLAVTRLVSNALPYENESYFDKKADRRVRKIMKNALFYCLFFSILSSVLLFTCANAIGKVALNDTRTIPALKILAFTLVPISLSSALNGYFCAVRRVYKNVILQLCEQFAKITVVSSLLVLIAPRGLEYACIAVVAGGAVSEAVCVIFSLIFYVFDRKIHKNKKFEIKGENSKKSSDVSIFDIKGVKKGSFISFIKREKPEDNSIIKIALPVAVSTYVRSALLTIEHLAIPWGLKKSGASATQALSSYGVLHGMVFPILLFPSAILSAFSSLLIPELSSAHEQGDTKRIKSIVSRVFYFALLFSVGVAGIFVCFSSELGKIIYNNSEAGEFIKLLSPLIPLMYLDNAVDSMLKGLGEQLYTMRVNIIDALMSVVLVVTLLPWMGIKGYVVVIFLMELFNTSFSIIKLLSITKIETPIKRWVFKPLGCVIASTIITRGIFSYDIIYLSLMRVFDIKILTFVEIGACALIYLILTRLCGAISKEEIRLAKSLVKRC